MRRRSFLKSGLLAAAGLNAKEDYAGSSAVGSLMQPSLSEVLDRHMIWCAEELPVPLTDASSTISGPFLAGAKPVSTDMHTAFVRELILTDAPSNAVLHLFAFTRYRLYINGGYAGRGPSRFQNQRPEYDSREVTGMLVKGRNVLAILVHRDAPTGRIMSHAPGFTAVLEWTNRGGAAQRLSTGIDWKAKPDRSFGSRARAWSSIEETIDARFAEDLTAAALNSHDWPNSVRVDSSSHFPLWPRSTPLQLESPWTLRPNTADLPLELSAPAEVTFDVPQVMQAYHVLEFQADAGSRLEVSYRLPDQQQSGTNRYTARVGAQTYMGGDTFAFNRLVLRLVTGRLTLTKAQAIEVRYPFERVGRFTSSDPFLDHLWAICARSIEVLSEDAYVDCADRERVEWSDNSPPGFGCTRVMMTGPAAGRGKTWSDARLLQALLRRIALTQQPDGQVKAHTCSDRFDIHAIMEDRSCGWVLNAREYFESTGDKPLLREIWPVMKRLMSWFLARRTRRGLVLGREWEAWDNPLRYQVCEGAGLNAFIFHALRDAAYIGRVIGEKTQSESFDVAADQLAAAFNTLLWDQREGAYFGALFGPGSEINTKNSPPLGNNVSPDGAYRPTVQAALYALDSGIVLPDRIASVQQWVLLHQAEVTGPASHHFLFKTLYAIGTPELDLQVLTRMRTGWQKQVESTWQTTWEDLEGGGSKVHIYGAVPAYFLSSYVLGVRLHGPAADKSILIEPCPGGLSHAEGVVVTEFGLVPIAWTQSDGTFAADFTVPTGTRALVRLRDRGTGKTLIVDRQRQAASTDGRFLVVELPAGRHVISHGS